ncbi:hypothetical protein [Nocardioides houyundeii]|uniref:hypothetical protein n=1 Tax=Nocardioides houyundeii TaxID=2045452 RepID=UPI000DF33BEC|nr:hypothetical protein [Nocardioides houyundeii]
MADPTEDLHVLREETDVLLQQSEEIRARLRPVEATDATGQVAVEHSRRVHVGRELTPAVINAT